MRLALLLLLLAVQDPPQEEEEPGKEELPNLHEEKDPRRCEHCKEPLKKAIKFVREYYTKVGNTAAWGNRWGAGLLLITQGKGDKDLQAILDWFKKNYKGRGGNRNWHFGVSFHFLSVYYLRYKDPEVKDILINCIEVAEKGQEETGGWCHSKGFWRGGYHRVGGGKDIAALTSMIFSSLWNMKAAGLEVPEALLERIEKNLTSLSDRRGSFTYGTANPSNADNPGTRGAMAIMGILRAGEKEHEFVDPAIGSVKTRALEKVADGHGFGPLHFYAVASALYRTGEYDLFASKWLDRLIEKQGEDGSVNIGGHPSFGRQHIASHTGIFAILLMMQQPGVFQARAAGSSGKGRSGFGRKKKTPKKRR